MGKKTVKKTAVLRLLGGNLREGCPTIELQIYQGKDKLEHRTARLPQNPELYESLQDFLSYEDEQRTRSSRHTMPREVQNNPDSNFNDNFNEWLRNTDFKGIKEFFISHARDCDFLIIESNELEIMRLPWSRWEVIQTYCPNIGVSYTS